jgi:hypothetical protein
VQQILLAAGWRIEEVIADWGGHVRGVAAVKE